MSILDYPFDSAYILQKKKSIKKELLANNKFIDKKVAILSGSTIGEIKNKNKNSICLLANIIPLKNNAYKKKPPIIIAIIQLIE